VDDGTVEAPGNQRGDDEPALGESGVHLGVAGAAEHEQAVAVEVRAALGALPDVMHLEAVRGQAAGLALPVSAGRPALTRSCARACLGARERLHFWHMSHTITVRVPKELAAWLEQVAAKTGVPQGKIVRDQLERAKAGSPRQSFMRLAGSVRGPRDLSSRKGFARS
jgi:hypothetical protein